MQDINFSQLLSPADPSGWGLGPVAGAISGVALIGGVGYVMSRDSAKDKAIKDEANIASKKAETETKPERSTGGA